MKLKTIKAKIESILGEITGTGEFFAQIHTFPNPIPEEYPNALVVIGKGTKKRALTNADELEYGFTIRAIIAPDDLVSADSEEKIATCIETVLGKFNESDYIDTLGGVCENFEITDYTPFASPDPFPNRGVDFQCVAKILEIHT